MTVNNFIFCTSLSFNHVICVFQYRTGRERHAMLSMVFSLWVMSSTATSSSLPTTVGTLETLFATTTTPTSAPTTRTMTNAWMTVLSCAKVNSKSNPPKTIYAVISRLFRHDFSPVNNKSHSFPSPAFRWVLVQLLHWFKPEWCLLPLRWAHKEHRWDHLVWLAWIHLLPQKSRDEGSASGFSSIRHSSVCPGSWSHAWMLRDLSNTFFPLLQKERKCCLWWSD